MSIRTNDKGLIYLDSTTMTAIFDCVYYLDDKGTSLEPETNKLLRDEMFKDFIKVLKGLQDFNYRYRFSETRELFLLFESTIGPMEANSDGTTLWLALGLAIKELYGLRRATLRELLLCVKVRK